MHQKAELGKYMGGTVPLGYKISKDKDYIIDENTAFIVKQIYERYADGYTIKEICNELNVAGYKTASGKPFSYSSLHTMLINPKYIGKYEYLGVVLENAIPQIVDNETFEKVQQRLQKNNLMLNFEFCSPTHFVFGKDTEQQTGDLALRYGAKKVLIVYGQGSVVRSGLLARVEKSLTEAGLCFGELGGVKPNPEDDLVREGIAMVRREKYDFLLAVGGGSAIDTAKAIALGVPYDGDFWDFYAGKAEAKEAMPVGVVLTIPAAGSEASGNTVITNVATGQKISLRCPLLLRPRFSVLNPELTFTLPHFQTACGICDMMVHIFERYFSNTPSTEVTDRISEGLLQSIITEGRRLMECPDDYEARANIMWAGTLAHNGVCGTGREEDWSSHAIEHELSALYGVTHGAGLAVVFPAWLKVVSKVNDFRTLQLAERLFGIEADGRPKAEVINECISHLQDFWSGTLGLPRNLSELGIDNADIDQLVNNLHHTKGEVFGGYVKLNRELTRDIYKACED